MNKLQMFLSHVHVESRFADFVGARVKRDFIGLVDVFVASDGGILAGRKWLDEMTDALKRSDLHVVLCSPDAVTRHWISFETGAAHLRGIPLIPLCHSGLEPKQLPVPLSEFEGILLCGPEGSPVNDRDTGFKSFYRAIANALGSDVPAADFESYERELVALEQTYAREHGRLAEGSVEELGVEVVRNPKALCVSSQQFMRQGFGNQLEMVVNAFPSSIQHDRVFDSATLKRLLAQQKVDVVHVAAYVCPRSGDVYFSDVDLGTGEPGARDGVDKITADALEQLLEMAETRLVVITGADSMALTATLLGAAHVIAARDMVSPKMLAAWVDEFYSMLPTHPLSKALDFAMKASRAPMRLYAKQPKSVDLVLEMAVQSSARELGP
jgi:TIR domain